MQFVKELVRNTLAQVPGIRFWIAKWIFYRSPKNTHRFLGVFESYEEAKAHIPERFNCGFKEVNLWENLNAVRDRDVEVVRILSGLISEIKTLFDLGGNIGVCYYQYKSQISYPKDFRWVICDVPPVNQAGEKIARERGETQLSFTDDRQAAEGVDVYLTSGVLQCLEVPFADILAKIKRKPEHLLINRLPLTDKPSFYTLQHMDYSVVPYYIANFDTFVSSIEALGYKLVERWKNDRFCDIILRPDYFVPNYHGFHFHRITGEEA